MACTGAKLKSFSSVDNFRPKVNRDDHLQGSFLPINVIFKKNQNFDSNGNIKLESRIKIPSCKAFKLLKLPKSLSKTKEEKEALSYIERRLVAENRHKDKVKEHKRMKDVLRKWKTQWELEECVLSENSEEDNFQLLDVNDLEEKQDAWTPFREINSPISSNNEIFQNEKHSFGKTLAAYIKFIN